MRTWSQLGSVALQDHAQRFLWARVGAPHSREERHLRIWLPPSYLEGGAHYPVVYALDGQNVLGFGELGERTWQGAWALDLLARFGREAILVGVEASRVVPRSQEYSPFVDHHYGGGDARSFVEYVADGIKPWVDQRLRTLPARETTVVLGSSLGALAALFAHFERPDVFGRAGVMSPSVSFAGGALTSYVEGAPVPEGRVYLDAGTQEFDHAGEQASRIYLERVQGLERVLRERCVPGRTAFAYVEVPGASHDEPSWGARLPEALAFLLAP